VGSGPIWVGRGVDEQSSWLLNSTGQLDIRPVPDLGERALASPAFSFSLVTLRCVELWARSPRPLGQPCLDLPVISPATVADQVTAARDRVAGSRADCLTSSMPLTSPPLPPRHFPCAPSYQSCSAGRWHRGDTMQSAAWRGVVAGRLLAGLGYERLGAWPRSGWSRAKSHWQPGRGPPRD
jgi:hypothetical protein